ncbi:MAG: hypothetical protein WC492_02770 [Candidatus Micrarchaeia archaeon]
MMLMAKKGKSYHTKRIAISRHLPVKGRKNISWIKTPCPGPHSAKLSTSLLALLRDELGLCADSREAKLILNSGQILVDSKKVNDLKRPIGMMDIISSPSSKQYWRMQNDSGVLRSKEISKEEAGFKYCKVVVKKSSSGAKFIVTLHDGRNMIVDNQVKSGSTLKLSLPSFKMEKMLPLSPGSKCFVFFGKHAGKIAKLEKIESRAGSMPDQAMLEHKDGAFTTLAKYLMAIDDGFGN